MGLLYCKIRGLQPQSAIVNGLFKNSLTDYSRFSPLANGKKYGILCRKTLTKGDSPLEMTDQILDETRLTEPAPDPQDPKTDILPRSRRPRAEWILGLIALLCALIVGLTVVVCLPYMKQESAVSAPQPTAAKEITLPTRPPEEKDEDPQSLRDAGDAGEELPSIEPIIEPEKNPYGRLDFQYDKNNYLYCLRQPSYPGVDVSAFQRDIDWQKVKDSGIRFAMLRLGYRGYESGKLVEDEYIQKNLKATQEVGMPIGAYFFSQALTIKEVDEEIAFMLKVLGDYELHMPIVLDWEIPTADARTARMDARTLTALQEYFCDTMTEKGFTPMVYFNWHQSNTLLYLNELEDYPFWLALYGNRMTYPYHVEMWQYTDSGKVPGIQGGVDLNLYMPKQ